MTNTIITVNGTDYQLIREAELANNQNEVVYTAPAIIVGAEQDDMGCVDAWALTWELPEYTEDEEMGRNIADMIDWDHPDSITPCGGYQIGTGRLI